MPGFYAVDIGGTFPVPVVQDGLVSYWTSRQPELPVMAEIVLLVTFLGVLGVIFLQID